MELNFRLERGLCDLCICANREIINEALVMVIINLLYLSVTVRKCSPLIMSYVTLGFCYSVNHCALGTTKFQDFSSLRLNGSWNRGLMRRWFITCSDSTHCHRLVVMCNLKNVTQSVAALSFAVSSLFLVFSHKFLLIISTEGKGKLAPFHVIHLEWRYSTTNNNVGTKWK